MSSRARVAPTATNQKRPVRPTRWNRSPCRGRLAAAGLDRAFPGRHRWVHTPVEMTIADQRLAEVATDLDAVHLESARDLLVSLEDWPAPEREAEVLLHASGPVESCVIRLAVGQTPGDELWADLEWAASVALSRREVLINQTAGLDVGMADRSLRLLDWIDSQIRPWPEPDWSSAVRSQVDGLVEAVRRGRRRGEQLRRDRKHQEPPRAAVDAGWLLRHPPDHYFCQARAAATDSWLREELDEWVSVFAPSYEALAALDWSAEQDSTDLVVELQLRDPVPHDWNEPAPAVVLATHRGTAIAGSELRLRQVADPDERFNGKAISLLPDESWLVCASRGEDGTLIPADGTRRQTQSHPRLAGVVCEAGLV